MDIVITSDNQNPVNFFSSYNESIDIDDSYEIAMKSIFHAPAFNISSENNRFSIVKQVDDESQVISHFQVKPGFYESRSEIMEAMRQAVAVRMHQTTLVNEPSFVVDKGIATLDMSVSKRKGVTQPGVEKKFFVIDPDIYINSSILPVLGYCNTKKQFLDKLEVEDLRFESGKTAGFVYSSIVKNSLINHTQSRLLATVPIASKPGHNYFEFQNPTYRALSTHSITDITCVITDINGIEIQLDNVYMQRKHFREIVLPTIVNLHIRKRRSI